MKTKEVIEYLSKLPEDTEVFISLETDYGHLDGELTELELESSVVFNFITVRLKSDQFPKFKLF